MPIATTYNTNDNDQ